MEVHHHSHTERKKWTHYFWEFLMLFLAVFCGFLAEYQLEHKIERDREKQYMRSMVKDLEKDVKNIDINLAQRTANLQQCDSLMQLLNSPHYAGHTGLIYFLGRIVAFRHFFYMTDGTFKQLENAGGFRLIRRQEVVDNLQEYKNLYSVIEQGQYLEDLFLRDYRDAVTRVFDVSIFNTLTNDNVIFHIPEGNPPLFSNDRAAINELLMRIMFLERNKTNSYNQLKELKEKGKTIIALIKKEYNLK